MQGMDGGGRARCGEGGGGGGVGAGEEGAPKQAEQEGGSHPQGGEAEPGMEARHCFDVVSNPCRQ